MTKYEESKELLKQEIIARRLPLEAHFPRHKDLSHVMLTQDLAWDYAALRSQIAWKILFIKLTLDQSELKHLPEGVSCLNKKRLNSELSKAQNILHMIDQRMNHVESLQSEGHEYLKNIIRKENVASKVRNLFEDE